MSPEIITMIAMGIAIIGIQMTTFIYLLNRMDKMSDRMDVMQKEMIEGKQEVLQAVSALSERVARLEGIIIGRQEVSNGTFTQTGTQTGDD